MARHDRLCAIAVLATVLLSGCGARPTAAGDSSTSLTSTTTESAAPTTSSPSPPPRFTGGASTPPAQDNRCTAAMLTGSVEPKDADAGSRRATLVVRNKSQQVCTLWGYGRLDLLDVEKNSLPTNAERNLNPVPTLVRLRPDAAAAKILRWSVVAAEDEPTDGQCQPAASSIKVSPPDEEASFEVDFEFGPVCDHGRLDTSAYYPR
ncbi:DUF4232 domain-containing protein [Actinophytocola sp. NPDC049390]|uniref:DUF4232 domain-containing protein n=1 Tax=Actinophytocola sp. NPDC049390 TaxID=3363894 RepID=UPI0037B6F553